MSGETKVAALPSVHAVRHGSAWVPQGSQFSGLYLREIIKTFRNPFGIWTRPRVAEPRVLVR